MVKTIDQDMPDARSERKPRRPAREAARPEERARPSNAENSIRPTKRWKLETTPAAPPPPKGKGHDATPPTSAPKASSARHARDTSAESRAIPDEVRKQFVQVGRKYFFPDGARAFTDRGGRLTTPSENTEVIRSLVTIAQARGWSNITVSGTERFRKEAWSAAQAVGLAVRGYTPTELETAHLVRTLARRSAPRPDDSDAKSASPTRTRSRDRRGGLLVGKLIDHGRATYRHDPKQPVSYFVKIENEQGSRLIWGVDLERAFKESLTKPEAGDEIGLRAVRQDTVTVKKTERDGAGKVIGERNLDTHRNRWIVEKRSFFEARAEAARTVRDTEIAPRAAVRTHPELAGTYLSLHAAEIAARRFRDPEDQRRFVSTVRQALADSVARGESLPPVRLRERVDPQKTPPASRRSPSDRNRERARDAPSPTR
jgi:putative DNA primase/helicase